MTMSPNSIVGIGGIQRQFCILKENFFPYITIPEESFPRGSVALVDWRGLAKNFPKAVLRIFDRVKWQYSPALYLGGSETWLPYGESHSVPFLQPENILPPSETLENLRGTWKSFNYTGDYNEGVKIWVATIDTAPSFPDKASPAHFLDCLLILFANPGICFMEEVVFPGSDYALGFGMKGILSITTRDRGSVGKRNLQLSAYPKNRIPHGLTRVQLLPVERNIA